MSVNIVQAVPFKATKSSDADLTAENKGGKVGGGCGTPWWDGTQLTREEEKIKNSETIYGATPDLSQNHVWLI